MKDNARIPSGQDPENSKVSSTVPPATLQENKPTRTHNRSHAAHLDSGGAEPRTKPAGDLRQGSHPGGRKQP
jgi:hypothetical protein